MNYRFIARQLGLLMLVLSGLVFAVAVLSWFVWGDGTPSDWHAEQGLLAAAGVGFVFGAIMMLFSRKGDNRLGRREALLLVALSWGLGAAVSALPYYIWANLEESAGPGHPYASFADCYFESMSGLTTTGATVLSDIEVIPHSLLLWRALTHWLGGLGIVVLFVAVLPTLGVGGKRLFQVEAPGPKQPGVTPRIRETARVLWLIYCGLTVAEIIILRICGMTWFDSICHTFATLATGGFSTYNASAGHFTSPAIHIVLIVFMLLAGVNFGLYYQLIRGDHKRVWKDPELRLYLTIILVATVLITIFIWPSRQVTTAGETLPAGSGHTVLHSLFQVISIQTTTGFCSVDFDLWPFLPKFILILLMFVGGSAGSTGGGVKVIRILIGFRVMLAEIERVFRPNVVRTVKIGQASIDPEMRLGVMVYLMGIIVLTLVGAGLLMILESPQQIDFVSACTASIASLNNIGPGLVEVGATKNFGWFSAPSKVLLSLWMALGRLEVYVIFVLFVPSFWRHE